MRVVERTVELPLSADAVWERLLQGETFLYVARGLLGVANPGAVRGPFCAGQSVRLWLRLLHVVPAGWHDLTIERIDPVHRVMQTRERSWLLPVWNHTLTVEATEAGRSRYTDRIEFQARGSTRLAVPIVRAFFAYRQWRWQKLAGDRARS